MNHALEFTKKRFAPLSDWYREMDRAIDDGFWPNNRAAGLASGLALKSGFTPAVEVVETDKSYEITVDLPGVPKDQIKLDVKEGELHISGERKSATEKKENGYWVNEKSYGSFYRSFTLPKDIKDDSIEAKHENGVLHVSLPKLEAKETRTLEVR